MVPSFRIVMRTITGRAKIPGNVVMVSGILGGSHDSLRVNAEEHQKLHCARNAVDHVILHPLEDLPGEVDGFHDD